MKGALQLEIECLHSLLCKATCHHAQDCKSCISLAFFLYMHSFGGGERQEGRFHKWGYRLSTVFYKIGCRWNAPLSLSKGVPSIHTSLWDVLDSMDLTNWTQWTLLQSMQALEQTAWLSRNLLHGTVSLTILLLSFSFSVVHFLPDYCLSLEVCDQSSYLSHKCSYASSPSPATLVTLE